MFMQLVGLPWDLPVSCEVETLERAFHSLIELGDQQMADLYCIQEWM